MPEDVFILGSYTSVFGRRPDTSLKELTREAYLGVLADAGLEDGRDLAGARSAVPEWMIGGSRAFAAMCASYPSFVKACFRTGPRSLNEGACATGSIAIAEAGKAIRAGDADLTLAIGIEKLYDPINPKKIFETFSGGFDMLDPQESRDEYSRVATSTGVVFSPSSDHTIAMDTYAIQANYHMRRYGTTPEQIAFAAAKNHNAGALNPKAQYRFETTPDKVLADRMVVAPLTRSMCAPIGDGAAAALLCSRRFLDSVPIPVRRRAVRLRSIALSGGKYRSPDEPSLTRAAADRAYAAAGLGPEDIDVAEVHLMRPPSARSTKRR